MKIAFITPGYLPMPPVKGGAVENLLDIFLKNNEISKQHKITVFSEYTKEAKFEAFNYEQTKFVYINSSNILFRIKQITIYILNKFKKNKLANAYIRKIKKIMSKSDDEYDFIIIENKAEFVLYLDNIEDSKFILHLHNDYLNEDNSETQSIVNSYDAIFTVSNFVSERIKRINASTPVFTLNNGIDLKRFDGNISNENKESILEKYNIEDEFIFLYTGRIDESKGVDQIIKAYLQLPKNINTKLLIVGSVGFGVNKDNRYSAYLRKISSERKNDIIFTGYVDYNQLEKIYAIANVGLVPSRINEAFGLTVIEHLASGNPVIATNVGGIPEIVNRKNSVLIANDSNMVNSLKDAMIYMATNQVEYEEMKSHTKESVQKYDSKTYFNNFISLLDVITTFK